MNAPTQTNLAFWTSLGILVLAPSLWWLAGITYLIINAWETQLHAQALKAWAQEEHH